MIHYNIDRFDEWQVSKAPFTYESTMELAGDIIPAGSFISLKIYAEDLTRVPFRMHSIMQDGRVTFCDADGYVVAYWQTYENTREASDKRRYISSLLVNENGIIAGHICCTQTVIAIIRNIVATNTETFFVPSDAFVLLPQCHIAMIGGIGRSFNVQNVDGSIKKLTGDLHIVATSADNPSNQMVLLNAEPSISIDALNTGIAIKKQSVDNGICTILVDGETVWSHTQDEGRDTNLIIKAGILSNLRLSKENRSLTLTGVNNA